jgi:hypothetical protein
MRLSAKVRVAKEIFGNYEKGANFVSSYTFNSVFYGQREPEP